MTIVTKLDLNDREQEQVNQLCAQFDPEKFLPEWMRERGERADRLFSPDRDVMANADWEAYVRSERLELRHQVEVAVFFAPALTRLDHELRLPLFYRLEEDLSLVGDEADFDGAYQFQKLFSNEERDRLTNKMVETSEAAVRQALLIDGPQAVA